MHYRALLPSTPANFQRQIWLSGLLLLCACGSLWFLKRDAIGYLTLNPTYYTPYYWPRRYGVLLHVCAGMLALSIGLIQIYLGLTRRTQRAHRWLGRIYVTGVLAAATAALYLVTQIPVSAYSLGLVGLATAWLVTTGTAYCAVLRRQIARHRTWMIRSYVVTFGFVSFRFMQNVMMASGMTEDTSVSLAAWMCWTIPLALVEVMLRRRPAAIAGVG